VGLTKKEVIELRNRCETDLRFLCRDMLSMTAWEDSLHGDLAKFLDRPEDKKLILIPRGHLKSSIVTCGWAIQQILKNPNVRILIANAVWDIARSFLREITGFLTDKSLLSEIYGKFDGPGSKFTQDQITVSQRSIGTIKEPTISTAGVETSLTGSHYNIMIMDDLVEENNVSTADQIRKIIRFYQNSLDLLDPGGQILVVGTRWSEGDLYGHLITSEMDSLNGVQILPEMRARWRELLRGKS
jgi:hypothetical protein